MRTGIIAKKIGMTKIFNDEGQQFAVTVLSLEDCQVITAKTKEKDGYDAIQIGAGKVKLQRVNKPLKGHFIANKVEPRKKLAEFRITDENIVEKGALIKADHFVIGQKVDVTAKSKGKGFAGPMKRWNFKGGNASHGNSASHRSIGSTGGCQDPGKVFKGKKMAGHMGYKNVTVQNLEVLRNNVEKQFVVLKGAVPGANGEWVYLKDAYKKVLPKQAPKPASFQSQNPNVISESPQKKTEKTETNKTTA